MNRTREDIIISMCYTCRHDFGLDRTSSDVISSGMTPSERDALYKQMSQVFDNCIAPHMEMKS